MLGDTFDLSIGLSPVDLSVAANTGKRVSLAETTGLTIVLVKAAGTAGEDPVLTLKQHTAASGGTTSNLAVITEYFLKNAAPLAGSETWTKLTQAAAATITDPGGAGTSAESEQLVAIRVRPDQLSAGNSYVSLDVADVGAAAQRGAVLYILDVADHMAPADFQAPLR